jgi:NAD(P)H dehydrogenase (quinone)
MIIITGATGQLGREVVEQLLAQVAPSELAVLVRSADKAAPFAARGVSVRVGDYGKPDTLRAALAGVHKLLLISSSEIGQREAQHRAVIDAAKAAGVGFVAYTSLLHADRSPLALAVEHLATERALAASGLRYALLRNGWYTENFTAQLPGVLAHGAFLGAAGAGRFAAATRRDYAAAAVAVLTREVPRGAVYELAGDAAFTVAELAAAVSQQVGRPIAYHDLPPAELQATLEGMGLPSAFAAVLVDSDLGAAKGALYDGEGQLRALIGRPTTPLAEAVADALRGLAR